MRINMSHIPSLWSLPPPSHPPLRVITEAELNSLWQSALSTSHLFHTPIACICPATALIKSPHPLLPATFYTEVSIPAPTNRFISTISWRFHVCLTR